MEFTVQQATHQLSTSTRGKGLYNITLEIRPWVIKQKLTTGLLTIFIPHTSASIVIQENADPDVLHDLTGFFQRLVPDGDSSYLRLFEELIPRIHNIYFVSLSVFLSGNALFLAG